MSKSNGDRMLEIQQEQGWDDENLGDMAIAFVFDPDEAGKGAEFVEYLERTIAEGDV